ncbi:MAG: zinc-binding dehydrogenase [Candidatus Hermodarchaeota archaeon]
MMKAAVFDGKNINIKQVTKPEPSSSEALIRVKAVGICGTDLAIINGDLPSQIPLILGHEFSGDVVKVGKEVNSKWIGKRITSEINTNIDFNCFYCKCSINTQCISRKALGIDVNGALAEYITVESYLLHEFPEFISYEEATFIEPLAAAYQTFEMMPLDSNDKTIAIFGLGKLGLLICQVAKLKGLKVIVIDGSEKKLSLAKSFGASNVINRLKTKNIPKTIQDLTNNLGADIVLDASGNPAALNDIIASCRTRGKLHIKSTHGLATPLNITDIVVRELTLYSSRCGPFDKAIEGIESGAIKIKDLISETYFLDDIQDAIENYNKSKDHIKTIIKI